MGILYLVSTPIGNLEDLTPRARRILAEVDLVLAEDTRRTGLMLHHLGIRVPLRSLHRHNEESRVQGVLDRLSAGESIALVSDAGTPLVSDPGERLVARAIQEEHTIAPLPGPSAVLAALVGSGLPTLSFAFLGFVPRKGKDRAALLERVAGARETVVVFESPERTAALLAALAQECGPGRRASVARELTKVHEEFRRGTLEELAAYYAEHPPRGEVTVVVGAAEADALPPVIDDEAALALGRALLDQGVSPSRAARELAERLGISRNRAYALLQELPE